MLSKMTPQKHIMLVFITPVYCLTFFLILLQIFSSSLLLLSPGSLLERFSVRFTSATLRPVVDLCESRSVRLAVEWRGAAELFNYCLLEPILKNLCAKKTPKAGMDRSWGTYVLCDATNFQKGFIFFSLLGDCRFRLLSVC